MTGRKTKFTGTITIDVEIEVSDELIAGVLTPEWRKAFYPLKTAEEVAYHLAYNEIRNGLTVSRLDGFADRPESDVRVTKQRWEPVDWEPAK